MDAVLVDGSGAPWNGLRGEQSMTTVVEMRRFGMAGTRSLEGWLDVDGGCFERVYWSWIGC